MIRHESYDKYKAFLCTFWLEQIYIYIYMYGPVIFRPIWALGFNLIMWPISSPNPGLRSPLSPLNKRSSLVHTTHAFWVIPGKLLPEKGSHCSVVLSLGCSTVPRKYWRRAYPLRWEAVPMPLLPLLPKHPLWSNRIGPPTH